MRWKILIVVFILLFGISILYYLDSVMGGGVKLEDVCIDEVEKSPSEVNFGVHKRFSDDDLLLIASVVMTEARGEPFSGQIAVAQVIYDRMEIWEKSAEEILFAENQFAEPYQGTISDEVMDAVLMVFENGWREFEEPTLYFHATYVDPEWGHLVRRGQIGGHLFYGEGGE